MLKEKGDIGIMYCFFKIVTLKHTLMQRNRVTSRYFRKLIPIEHPLKKRRKKNSKFLDSAQAKLENELRMTGLFCTFF